MRYILKNFIAKVKRILQIINEDIEQPKCTDYKKFKFKEFSIKKEFDFKEF